jgi:hypothetical protein
MFGPFDTAIESLRGLTRGWRISSSSMLVSSKGNTWRSNEHHLPLYLLGGVGSTRHQVAVSLGFAWKGMQSYNADRAKAPNNEER